ncbi:MAG TPA: hypothetical protein VIM99_11275 [Blastocatellia bacterium]
MSGYEKMERAIDATKENGEPHLIKGREFIWNCWKQKRRCFSCLKVEFKDAPPNVIQIFIEPNEEGAWNAVYMLDAQPLDKNGKPKGKPVSWRHSSRKLVRVDADYPGKNAREIPDDEIRTPDAYKIYLKLDNSVVAKSFAFLFGKGAKAGLLY